jgi:tetratricopeptide (TPR) repeat protein
MCFPGSACILISEFYQLHDNDLNKAMQFCQTPLTLVNSKEDSKVQLAVSMQLAWLKSQTGDYSAARVHAHEAWRLTKISGNIFREASAIQVGSVCWHALGSYSHSIFLFQRARQLLNLCGLSDGTQDRGIMIDMAEVHRTKSEYAEARSIHSRILDTVQIKQEPSQYALAILNIAQIDVEVDASKDEVQRNIATAQAIYETMGDSISVTYCETIQAALHLREGSWVAANTLFLKCLRFSEGKLFEAVTYCLERLGNVRCWSAVSPTSTWPIVFLGHALKIKNRLEINKAIQFLGDMSLLENDQQTAISLFTVALEGFTQMDIHRSQAECMLQLGDISRASGNVVEALKLWETARLLFERSSQAEKVLQINNRLAGIAEKRVEGDVGITVWT